MVPDVIESQNDSLEETIERAKGHMRLASSIVLGGFELDSDAEVFSHPERFGSPGPESFFLKVVGILERIEGASIGCTHLPQGQGRRVHPSYSLYKESV